MRLAIISRRDGERLREVASWTPKGMSTRSPLADYAYLSTTTRRLAA